MGNGPFTYVTGDEEADASSGRRMRRKGKKEGERKTTSNMFPEF